MLYYIPGGDRRISEASTVLPPKTYNLFSP